MCKNGKFKKLHNKITLVLLIGLLAASGLIGCGDKSSPANTSPTSEIESEISMVSKELPTESNTSSEISESESTEPNNIESTLEASTTPETTTELESNYETETLQQIETTELFEQVYVPYANREKSFVFNGVKSFVENLEYNIKITEPSEDDLCSIKIMDTTGDYVFFLFQPINDIEIISLVSYYYAKTNSEVSMENYSIDGLPKYDKFRTHIIGENATEVSGTDEQRNFLFKKDLSEPFNDSTELISEHRTDEKIIGISNKNISDLNVKFYKNIENDTSGRWRLAEISEDVNIQNYIYSYYKEYFKDDSEFHVIVNHSRKITTSINPVHEALYVVEHNYVEDEKHDAKWLCAKPVIKEYYIHTDNGDIENLESTLESSIASETTTEPESESSIASETTTEAESESELFSTEVEQRTGE